MGQVPTFEKKTGSFSLWGTECGSRLLCNISIHLSIPAEHNLSSKPQISLLLFS